MSDYIRGVWDALVYTLGLLEARDAEAAAKELEAVKTQVEREAASAFKARLKNL